MAYTPQFFYLFHNDKLALLVDKIVDDLLITGEASHVEHFLKRVDSKFDIGTIVSGPVVFYFYGLAIEQLDDNSSTFHADTKRNALECLPPSCVRRRQWDSLLSEVELASFLSVKSSIRWLGIAASPLCVFYGPHLQQKMPTVSIRSLQSRTTFASSSRLSLSFGTLHRPFVRILLYQFSYSPMLEDSLTTGSFHFCWSTFWAVCSTLCILHAVIEEPKI